MSQPDASPLHTEESLKCLGQGAISLGLDLAEPQLVQLLTHLDLLGHWNRRLNLTAITSPSRMLSEHVLDSLAILPYLEGARFLDIGSGGGFPGIPVAIACPDCAVTLLDSRGKRVEFLRYAAGRLGLNNVEPVKSRIENYRPAIKFDTLVCRAFASMQDILQWTRALHQPGTRLIAMKGRLPDNELALLATDNSIRAGTEVVSLTVPQLDAERHLVIIDFA